jgi:hypothetical protein
MANYEWSKGKGMADWVLYNSDDPHEEGPSTIKFRTPYGFIMRSGPTAYTAWVPNDAGNRMEFFDVETAKAWVFTQVRMNDGSALLRTDSLR